MSSVFEKTYTQIFRLKTSAKIWNAHDPDYAVEISTTMFEKGSLPMDSYFMKPKELAIACKTMDNDDLFFHILMCLPAGYHVFRTSMNMLGRVADTRS